MKTIRTLFGILAVVLATLAKDTDARARDINNAALAGLVLNNTIPDNDFYALDQFVGKSTTDILSTDSIDSTSNFSQFLTGTYLGEPVNVDYEGTSGAFPAGAITWTITGSYGIEPWTGTGSATFTFPTSSTFQVAFYTDLTIGLNTMITNIIISGADDGTSLYYTGTTGTLTINGDPMTAPFYGMSVPLQPLPAKPDYDYIRDQYGHIIIVSNTRISRVVLGPGEMIADVGDIYNVPEPSSLVLASFGILGLLIVHARRRWGDRCGNARNFAEEPAA